MLQWTSLCQARGFSLVSPLLQLAAANLEHEAGPPQRESKAVYVYVYIYIYMIT